MHKLSFSLISWILKENRWCCVKYIRIVLLYVFISQGSVLTRLRWGGKYDKDLVANILPNSTAERTLKIVNICRRLQWHVFWPTTFTGCRTDHNFQRQNCILAHSQGNRFLKVYLFVAFYTGNNWSDTWIIMCSRSSSVDPFQSLGVQVPKNINIVTVQLLDLTPSQIDSTTCTKKTEEVRLSVFSSALYYVHCQTRTEWKDNDSIIPQCHIYTHGHNGVDLS